jgi:ferric-dicitrate binding protein FerR (iron transport regulator)
LIEQKNHFLQNTMEDNKDDDRSWYLASKRLTQGLSDAEELEWEALLRDEKFKNDFALLEKHWHALESSVYAQINVGEDWEAVRAKIRALPQTQKRFAFSSWLRYAAAAALFVTSAYVAWNFRKQRETAFVTKIEAPAGARTYVTLPDSSHVWLNAGTLISFDQHFGTDNRSLTLEGEAFFDVEKSSVPFKVHTVDIDIAVLGTAFNVKAYRNDDVVSTTLVRGALKVRRIKATGVAEEVLLRPNDKITLQGLPSERSGHPLTLQRNIDAVAEADWKDGWLTARGESLSELSKKIERLYNVTIHFENDSLKTYKYTGRIQQFSLEQVLKALALTSPIDFVINEKSVTLRENKNTKSKYKTLPTP